MMLCIACLCVSQAMATDFYVDTNHPQASDSNAGSITAPFKTIQHAVNLAHGSGYSIFVNAGVYNERVTFTSQNEGLAVLTWGSGKHRPVVQVWGFNTRSADSVVIEGFTVVNYPNASIEEDRCGVFVGSNSVSLRYIKFDGIHGPAVLMDKAKPWHTRTIIQACSIDNCSQGIVAYGSSLSILDNTIKHLMLYSGSNLEPVYMKLAGSKIKVLRNQCYGTNWQDAPGATVKLLEISESIGTYQPNIYFIQNIFKDYDVICDIKSDTENTISGIRFEDNIFAHGRKSGITLSGYVTSFRLLHNLFYDMGLYALRCNIGSASGYTPDSSLNNYAINNIFYNAGTQPISLESPSQLSWNIEDYNLLYTTSGTISGGSAHDVLNRDPLFVDAANNNFHLKSGSPAIDAGVISNSLFSAPSVYSPEDLNRIPRPQGNGFEIGPYEYEPLDSSTIDPDIIPVISGATPADVKQPNWVKQIFGGSADAYEADMYFVFDMSESHFSSGVKIPFTRTNPRYKFLFDLGDETVSDGERSYVKTYEKQGTYTLAAKIYDTVTGKMGIKTMTISIWPTQEWLGVLRLSMNEDITDYSGNKIQTSWAGTGAHVFSAGILGKTITLNGTSNGPYVAAQHNDLLDGLSGVTLSLWAKKAQASADQTILMKDGVYSIALEPQGVTARLYNAQGQTVTLNSGQISNNDTRWHHYGLMYNGTTAKLYFDGAQINAQAFSGNLAHKASSNLLIGKGTGNTFNGSLDAVRIFACPVLDDCLPYLYNGTQSGDVSLNGQVTAYDAAMTAKYAIGTQILTSQRIEQADVSGNGEVSAYDASLIARYAVGLIQKFDADARFE